MASTLLEVPFRLHLEFPAHRASDFDLSALPCPGLVRQLAGALLERTNTGGPIKSPSTARSYVHGIRHLARNLGRRGFAGSAAQLSDALIFDYWREAGPSYERATRVLLSHIEARRPGSLEPGLARQLHGVTVNPRAPHRPRQPYSAGETTRLLEACRAAADSAEARLAAAEALVASGADPAAGDWAREENVAWNLDRFGPMTARALSKRVGAQEWRVDRALRETLSRLHEGLFPTMEAVMAFRVLIGIETGICPEGIDGLGADCLEWVGGDQARISWFKARASGAESHVFPSRGPWSPGRLIERWLALSARARRHTPDGTALWLSWDRAHVRVSRPGFSWDARDRFVGLHGLLDDAGAPLRLRFGAFRATYFARHDRHWNGALRIDPNHSARVEGDHYLAQGRPSDPLEATIEAAQRDALRKAATAPLTLFDAAELAALVDDPEAVALRLGMSASAAAEVLGGERDVFAAGCKDFYNSPHGHPGAPCPSPVWSCLFCPLAVFTPAKVPNLLRLRDHLERQWKALGAQEWMHLYGAAQVRLERDILARFPAPVLEAARAAVSADGDDAGPYLAPEETPWPS